jgi:sulfur carrier protein
VSPATAAIIRVNGRAHPLAEGATVAALLRELAQAERPGIAVAVNGAVVPRGRWAEHALAPDDRVLIIQATQGG